MSADYVEYNFKVQPKDPGVEILIAFLGDRGFESFVETEAGFSAYIPKSDNHDQILHNIPMLDSDEFRVEFEHKLIPQQNWNARWEENFDPIEVDGSCLVRAPFHASKGFDYEIEIEPKMSFGTGHHQTTYMMLQFILENDFEGKKVLDMGCGTAVLAILAEKRGAKKILAIDNDPWSYENSLENVERNQCEHIEVVLGDATALPTAESFDVIIANINRNILLNDMEAYTRCLLQGGTLYLSGFYEQDLDLMIESCNKFGLKFVENKINDDWVAAKFVN